MITTPKMCLRLSLSGSTSYFASKPASAFAAGSGESAIFRCSPLLLALIASRTCGSQAQSEHVSRRSCCGSARGRNMTDDNRHWRSKRAEKTGSSGPDHVILKGRSFRFTRSTRDSTSTGSVLGRRQNDQSGPGFSK